MLDLRLDLDEAFFQHGTFRVRLLGDHALHPRELFRIEASQILETLILGHVHISCSVHLPAMRQHLARAEEGRSDVFPRLARSLRGKRVVDGLGVGDLRQRPGQVLPHAFALAGCAPLFFRRINLAGRGGVMHNPAIHPARGLQAHTVLLGLLDHGEAEVVIVEAMVAPQKEELAFLRAAVQHQMRMRVIAVLMHRDDVVEMPRVGLKEPLGHIGCDVAHILPARADGERHEHMGRLAQLGLEARIPALRKALGEVLDVLRLELRLAIQKPATVHDMGRLGGEVIKLVHQLRFRMRPPAPDRLEDRRTVPGCRAHKLALLGDMQPLHRAPNAAPTIQEHLARDSMDGIIQPHGQTPSARPWPAAASRLDGGAEADRSRQRNPE